MLIIETPLLLRQHIRFLRQKGKRIALVPTMGNLHDGHMKLVDEAKTRADVVVVSIFINPMQFEQAEDLANYPRTLQEDYDKLNKFQVDFVFSPTVESIYPSGTEIVTYIEVPIISTILEGASRIGHFRGVSTIVSKLFNLVQPDVACFGEKDFQQLAIIRKMVTDLGYDIEIISVPTVRTKDGLALSSRNSYLTTDQRKIGPVLNKIVNKVATQIQLKTLTMKEIIDSAEQKLNNLGFRVDYLQIRDANTLLRLTKASQRAVVLVAVWLGRTRLIDNKVINLIE